MALVYEEALAHPTWCPIQPQDCWTELPHANWNPLQRRLIDRMPGERINPRALTLPGRAIPRRLATSQTEPVEPERTTNPLAFLMTLEKPNGNRSAGGEPQACASTSPTLAIFHSGGREAEIEEVFRRIVSAGVSLDQVEIACASEAHVALLWEKALQHDWAVTLGPGPRRSSDASRSPRSSVSATGSKPTSPPVTSVVCSNPVILALKRMRKASPPGKPRVLWPALKRVGDARLTASHWDGCARSTSRAQSIPTSQTTTVRMHGTRLTSRHASSPGSRASWIGSRTGNRRPGSRCKPQWTPLFASSSTRRHARAPLTIVRHRRSSTTSESCAPSVPSRVRSRERCDSSGNVCSRCRSRRSVHVPVICTPAGWRTYGYSGRPHVFVVGLEGRTRVSVDGRDAVLLDAERVAISPVLRSSTDRIDEAVHAALARLAVSGQASITFSYSCRDTREFRENVCVLAHAAGVSGAAVRSRPLVSTYEGRAGRAEISRVGGTGMRRRLPVDGGCAVSSARASRGSKRFGATFDGVALGRKAGKRARPKRSPSSTAMCLRRARCLDPGCRRHGALGDRAGKGPRHVPSVSF